MDINEELPPVAKEGKKEEDEAALDGEEFIKVEKESIEIKDGTRNLSNSNRELLEAQEKTKELEEELQRLVVALKETESENLRLKDTVSDTKDELETRGKKYDEMESSHRKLQEQAVEAEARYKSEVGALVEALQAQEAKQMELVSVKEAFDGLSLELESSRKRHHELEELHKHSTSHAECQTQRAVEFERLLEAAKMSGKEMEDQMVALQEEVKGLYEKIAENEKVETALNKTAEELSSALDELNVSKSKLIELEQNLSGKDALVDELSQELEMRKVSESQVKGDISALEEVVASTMEELQAKVSELEAIKLKLQEEVQLKEKFEV